MIRLLLVTAILVISVVVEATAQSRQRTCTTTCYGNTCTTTCY